MRALLIIAAVLGGILGTALRWGIAAGLVYLLCSAIISSKASAAEQPAPGMTCTYTPPTAAAARPSRTYVVEVGDTFEASYDREGPWLWVKRPKQGRYQSVIVPPATLSECR